MPDNSKVYADLSHHQAGVDLQKYRAAGHTRIALKATEGTGFTDPAFAPRWKQAGQLGLARIAYHFARAKFDGADEFAHFWSVVQAAGGLGRNDRLCLDVEDPDTPNRAAANAREFVGAAVAQGIGDGLIYTYNYYATHHAIAPSQFPPGWRQLWLADYTVGQADAVVELGAGWNRGQVAARQYTDKETVAGVPGTCDCSRVLNDWLAVVPTPAPTPQEDVMTDAQMAELKKYIHGQVQAAVQAVLKGGSNSTFDGLPAGEVSAVQQVEDKVDQLLPPAGPTPA